MKDSRNKGFYIAMGLAFLAVIWMVATTQFRDDFFTEPSRMFNFGGRIFGTLGMALFALNFVFTARWRFMEKLTGPLDQQYRSHHMVGGLTLIFLLIHPLLMSFQYAAFSWDQAAMSFFDFSDWRLALGTIALVLLLGLLSITFYARWKYENWRLSHQWLGLPFFLGGIHAIVISLNPFLIAYTLLGGAALFWRTILKLYRKTEYMFSVEAVHAVTDRINELVLKPATIMPKFFPGQFAFVHVQAPGMKGQPHPFSITSDPTEDRLRFSIKNLGDFTSQIPTLRPGTTVRVEGPFGGFSYIEAESKKQIWIAGGIGITPFLAMARHLDRMNNTDYDIDLYYTVNNESEAAFFPEFRDVAARKSNFTFHPHFSNALGFLTADMVVSNNSDLKDTEIFLCGPASFMKSLKDQFKTKGVPESKIHYEQFSLQD